MTTPSILCGKRAPSKPAPIHHDPLVCGINPPDSDCEACRARAERAEREFLERDAKARARSRRKELAARFARLINCRPAELVEFIVEIALEAQGGERE